MNRKKHNLDLNDLNRNMPTDLEKPFSEKKDKCKERSINGNPEMSLKMKQETLRSLMQVLFSM